MAGPKRTTAGGLARASAAGAGLLGVTHGACPKCRAVVPAKVVSDGRDVHLRRFCPEHGESESLVRRDAGDYVRSLRYVKPAWRPLAFAGDSGAACPEGCGFCERHEQHLCMPVVEITSRCDLACPVCLVSAGGSWDLTLAEFRRVLDALAAAERQVDVLNFSGGEPFLHPELLGFVDEALSRPEIVRVSISTNGLRLLDAPELVRELRERNVVVSLQFDGFEERAYEVLRGRPLLRRKLEALDLLGREGAPTSLTMTAAEGVNDDQFGPMLDCLFSRENVVSMMIQPVAFEGRGAALARAGLRLTIPDVIRLLGEAGHPAVSAEDFVPLPCSHPLCFNLAFYLMVEGGRPVSMNQLAGAGTLMDLVTNRTIFGLDAEEHERLQAMIYELWSGPAGAAPDSEAVMKTLRDILNEMSRFRFDPREAFTAAERRAKSIFIHAFQDAETFDLARARRCCTAYPQADGSLVPACVHNVLRRGRRQGSDERSARKRGR